MAKDEVTGRGRLPEVTARVHLPISEEERQKQDAEFWREVAYRMKEDVQDFFAQRGEYPSLIFIWLKEYPLLKEPLHPESSTPSSTPPPDTA